MRKLLIILLCLSSVVGYSQVPVQKVGVAGGKVEFVGQLQSDSIFFLGQYADTLFNPGRSGGLIYRIPDKQLYYYNGNQWVRLTGIAWGTIPGLLSNQIDLYDSLLNRQFVLTNNYGIIALPHSVKIDTANFRKVDTVFRGDDTTINFKINGTQYSFNIRGKSGTGSVSSVALTAPASLFSVSGSPITSTGTFIMTFVNQNANQVFAGPTSGSPTTPAFRSLVIGDLPTGIPVANLQSNTIALSLLTPSGTIPTVTGSPATLGGTITLNVPNAGPGSTGFLTTADWNVFNSKVTSVNGQTGVTIVGSADSIKHLAVDTSTNRNGYVVTFDSTNHKFYLSVGSGSGSVTSVALALPVSVFSISGSPVTTTGTLTGTFANQTQNKVFASPNGSTGVPTFRALVNADLPATAVTPGTYTVSTITVNQQGVITAASNGAGTGITTINGLNPSAQLMVVGTSGSDFNIADVTATHTFNLPTASASNRGALASADWTTFNNKVGTSGNLSPLFTTSISGGALSFTLSNACAHCYLGNSTGSSGAPSYQALIPDTLHIGHAGSGKWNIYPDAAGDSLYGKNEQAGRGILITTQTDSSNLFQIDNSVVATLTDVQTLTNKTLTNPIINFGADANGDIITRVSGLYGRFPIGSVGQVLTVSASNLPIWANSTAGVSSIGTLNSQTASGNGAVIVGTVLYMQTASNANPGLATSAMKAYADTARKWINDRTNSTTDSLMVITNPNTTNQTFNFKGVELVAGANTTVTDNSTTHKLSYTIATGPVSLTSAHIFVGNGSNVATDVALSGDATMANTGAMTLASVVGAGSCTNCNVTFDAKGRATAFANGSAGGGGGVALDVSQTITSGTSAIVSNGVNMILFNPSSTIAAYSLTLPATAHNGNYAIIVFGGTLTSGTVITTLTVLPNSGESINGLQSVGSGMYGQPWVFKLLGTVWYRLQ